MTLTPCRFVIDDSRDTLGQQSGIQRCIFCIRDLEIRQVCDLRQVVKADLFRRYFPIDGDPPERRRPAESNTLVRSGYDELTCKTGSGGLPHSEVLFNSCGSKCIGLLRHY